MNEEKLQYLLDRQSIRDVLLRNAIAFDDADFTGLDDIWVPDCRRDDGEGRGTPIEDREELRRRLTASAAKFRWTHHQLGDSLIDIDGDTAKSMTFVACWHELLDGEQCWATARYYDEFRRDDDGRWRITLRRLIMTGAEGSLNDHGGNWLVRQLPASSLS